MRSLILACTGAIGLLACSFNSTGVTATGADAGTDAATSGATSSATTGDPAPTTGGSGGVCSPSETLACSCDGVPGLQTCVADGSGYAPCECADVDTTASTPSSTTTVDPDTTTAVDPSTTTTGEPGSSTTTVDPSTTTSDDTTTTSDDTTTTSDDTTGGPTCMQAEAEPNDDEGSALPAPDQPCKQPPKKLSGTLDGSGDADWWEYLGDFGNGCGPAGSHPHPTHTLTADPAVRMCVYFSCLVNNALEEFDCPMGTSPDTSAGGHPGCCTTGGALDLELNCVNVEDDAQLFVRLDMAPANACVDYSVSYTYNDD